MSKSIKLNAFFKSLMSIINIVFPLITVPYVARVLNIVGFTEYNTAQSMMSWFTPFAIFGVYTYGMRTISQIKNNKEKTSELFTRLFFINIFTSIITTILYTLLIFFNNSFSNSIRIYIIFSIQLLSTCFATDWYNEAFESYGFIMIKTFLCRIVYIICVLFFVRKPDDAFIYVLLTVLSTVLNNLLTFYYTKHIVNFSKTNLKKIIYTIKPLFIVFLLVNSSMLYTIFDKFVLTIFSNKLNLTYYNISQTIVLAVSNVTASLLLVSIPRLSHLWTNQDKNEYYSILKNTSSAFLAFHIPCCIGLALISKEILWLYSGSKYMTASSTLVFFSIRYLFSAFDMIQSKQILLATGNEKIITKIYYIGGIYNITTKIILIATKNITPELCIITTATADMIVIILEAINIKKLGFNFSIFSFNSIKYILYSLTFVPIIFVIKTIITIDSPLYNIVKTLLCVFLCVVVYGIILIITKDRIIYSIPVIKKFIKRKQNV